MQGTQRSVGVDRSLKLFAIHIVHTGPLTQDVQLGIMVHGTHVFVIDVLNTYPETQEVHVGPSTQEEQ